jgi:putative tricarboxylic transport membrane protein
MPMHASARALPFGVLLCAAAYLFTRTQQFDFPHVPGRLGPDVWPQMILVLLMVTCVVGIANAMFLEGRGVGRAEAGAPTPGPSGAQGADPEVPSQYKLVAGGIGLFLAYPLALDHLGFLVATFLLMSLFMLIGRWRNLAGVLTVSSMGTLVLFYVFRGIVYVSLPLGRGVFHDWTVWVASLLGMR